MKKVLILLLFCSQIIAKAQITLEQTYSVPPGKTFYFTDLGNNNFKYFFIDYYNNFFSLYNLDHTPFMLNITPGINLDSGKFTIGYISTTLFDCDSSNIEYAIMANGGTTIVDPFYVFRTDGTQIFQKDSVVTVWCFGCFGGITVNPIFNTSEGAKLLLANLNSNDWFVYGLCGNLPQAVNQVIDEIQHTQIFPNPSPGSINIQVNSTSSLDEIELSILNSSMQKIYSCKMYASKKITIDHLNSGIYFFTLQSKNKILQTGNFLITN